MQVTTSPKMTVGEVLTLCGCNSTRVCELAEKFGFGFTEDWYLAAEYIGRHATAAQVIDAL